MTHDADAERSSGEGATVVITHRVRDDRHAEYEAWLNEIAPVCRAAPGHLEWHIVRPISGLTSTYTVLIRFDTRARWKQYLVTWSAIYPLALAVPLVVVPTLRRLGAPSNQFLSTLCVTGAVVLLMVYVVMPRYTRLLHRGLYK